MEAFYELDKFLPVVVQTISLPLFRWVRTIFLETLRKLKQNLSFGNFFHTRDETKKNCTQLWRCKFQVNSLTIDSQAYSNGFQCLLVRSCTEINKKRNFCRDNRKLTSSHFSSFLASNRGKNWEKLDLKNRVFLTFIQKKINWRYARLFQSQKNIWKNLLSPKKLKRVIKLYFSRPKFASELTLSSEKISLQ